MTRIVALTLVALFALPACNGGEFQRTTTTTIAYIDENGLEHTETVTTTEFDQEAYAAVMEAADRLAQLAIELNKDEPKTPEEIAFERERYEQQRELLEALIAAGRSE